MRGLIRAALIASTALAGAAHAADVESGAYAGYGPRAGQLVFWDFEPGVVVRAYWLPPYGNRHFFPSSDVTPRLGRQENLDAPSSPTPAKSFYREWSSFPIDSGEVPIFAPMPPIRPKELPAK